MRFSGVLLVAALVGCASASYYDFDDRSEHTDALSLHRRIKAMHRIARRAQASCPASPTLDGTPFVVSPRVVCPQIAALGALQDCEPRPTRL